MEMKSWKRCLTRMLAAALAACCSAADVALDLRAPARASLQSAAPLAEDVVRQHRLGAGRARVSGLAVGDRLDLRLFEDRDLSVELVEETVSRRGRSFLGRTAHGLGLVDCVVLETEQGLVVDVTDSRNGRVWQVVSDADGVQVREAKPAQKAQIPSKPLAPPAPGAPVPVIDITTGDGQDGALADPVLPATSASVSAPASGPAVSDTQASAALQAAGASSTVDILVAYDTLAASWAKSNGGGLEAFAETSVQKMNTALANTGLDTRFRFRLVGVYEVGGTAGGDLSYALNCASGAARGSTDGDAWARVAGKREDCHADIVCVLTDTGSAYGTTGLGRSLVSTTANPADCGWNACAIQAVATGHTMTHEVGHNMGAGHSDAMADKGNCGPQYHSYSSGYYFHIGGTGYYTIMAYNSDGYGNFYSPVPYFSSPDYRYNGVAVGDATHNNSRTLAETWSTVVNNRREPSVSADVGVGLDAEAYEWTTDGTYPWTKVTDRTSDGVDSACSSLIPSTGTSWTETRVTGPATLSFSYYLVSYGGQFLVTCDGDELFTYGSATQAIQMRSWSTASGLSIPSGVHTIRFAHVNNNTKFYVPANAVWVDKVVFAGGSPAGAATTYTVTFDANGGSCATASKTVTNGESYGTLPTPTRAGYAFAGWFTSASGGTQVTSSTTASLSGAQTLYAHWTAISYSVKFNANGGSGTMANESFTYGTAKALTANAFTRTGYAFAGWATSASGAVAYSDKQSVSNLSSTSGATVNLYAVWTENAPVTPAEPNQTLSFAAAGESKTTASFSLGSEALHFDKTSVPAWVTGLTLHQRIGGTINNTIGLTGGTGSWNSSGSSSTCTLDVTVAANTGAARSWTFSITRDNGSVAWSILVSQEGASASSYTVTFDANGGSCATASKTYASGATLGTLPTPTRAGYTFAGWFTAADGGTRVTETTAVTGDATYYAHWTANTYTVTFDANGGTASESSRTKAYGSTLGTLPTATRTGYTLVGWYTAKSGGTEAMSSTKVTGAVMYYARWTAVSYTVTLDANGGTSAESGCSRDYGTTLGDLPEPTRTGYAFEGWYTAADGGTKVSSATQVTGDVTYYALWRDLVDDPDSTFWFYVDCVGALVKTSYTNLPLVVGYASSNAYVEVGVRMWRGELPPPDGQIIAGIGFGYYAGPSVDFGFHGVTDAGLRLLSHSEVSLDDGRLRRVRIDLSAQEGGVRKVRYSVDGHVLSDGGDTWFTTPRGGDVRELAIEDEAHPDNQVEAFYGRFVKAFEIVEPLDSDEAILKKLGGVLPVIAGYTDATGGRVPAIVQTPEGFSASVKTTVAGLYYTAFVAESLEGPFRASAASSLSTGDPLTFLVETGDAPQMFLKIVVSGRPVAPGKVLGE